MTTVKKAVTIDEDLAREASALAEGISAPSSTTPSNGTCRRVKLDRLMEADLAEHGPIDPDVQAEVDAEIARIDAQARRERFEAPQDVDSIARMPTEPLDESAGSGAAGYESRFDAVLGAERGARVQPERPAVRRGDPGT